MSRVRPRRAWLILALVLFVGLWLAYDGARALILGDYTTPSSGRFAGQLGPWAGLFEGLGINPRSTAVKALHVLYGALYSLAGLAWLMVGERLRRPLALLAVLGLWYLPFGTLINLAALALLLAGWSSGGGAQ